MNLKTNICALLLLLSTGITLLMNFISPPLHPYRDLLYTDFLVVVLALLVLYQEYVIYRIKRDNKHLEDSLNQALKELEGK